MKDSKKNGVYIDVDKNKWAVLLPFRCPVLPPSCSPVRQKKEVWSLPRNGSSNSHSLSNSLDSHGKVMDSSWSLFVKTWYSTRYLISFCSLVRYRFSFMKGLKVFSLLQCLVPVLFLSSSSSSSASLASCCVMPFTQRDTQESMCFPFSAIHPHLPREDTYCGILLSGLVCFPKALKAYSGKESSCSLVHPENLAFCLIIRCLKIFVEWWKFVRISYIFNLPCALLCPECTSLLNCNVILAY